MEQVRDRRYSATPVVATMSAVKSPLLNALMHTDLLLSQTEACTATVIKIANNVEESFFVK